MADAITIQVVRNRISSLMQEMHYHFYRSGYSTIIRELRDFSCVILDRHGGLIVAPPMFFHAPVYWHLVAKILSIHGSDIAEGDMFVCNHPYDGGLPHVSDMAFVSPIIFEGTLVGFSGSIAHKADVGGANPGSTSANATEIFQEGLLLPPVKMYTRGVYNDDLERLILANSRQPELVRGDMHAQMAATQMGAERIKVTCEQFGATAVMESFAALLAGAAAELRARSQRATGRRSIRRRLHGYRRRRARPAGSFRRHHPGRERRHHFRFQQFRPAGQGTDQSAAVDGRGLCVLLADRGARSQAAFQRRHARRGEIRLRTQHRDQCQRAGAGQFLSGGEPEADRRDPRGVRFVPAAARHRPLRVEWRVADSWKGGGRPGQPSLQYEILGSAYGGGNGNDGASAVAVHTSNLHITPIEILETEFPCRIVEFGMVQDSCGAGEFRGGLSFRRIYELLQDATVSRRYDKAKFPPRGVAGGKPGSGSRFIIHLGGKDERETPASGKYELRAGERFLLQSAGGGGYGDPENAIPRRLSAISRKVMCRPHRPNATMASKFARKVIVMADGKERVGIVGAGRMGLAMLRHLVKKGYAVTVCDISDKQRDAARALGAAVVTTPADVGKVSDIVILGVGYDDEVEDVVFGKNGLAGSDGAGLDHRCVVDGQARQHEEARRARRQQRHRGDRRSDLPRPLRGRQRHAAGAGRRQADVVERARPVYTTFASDYVHLGEVGNGQVGKAINNMMLWFNACGVMEAGRLAEKTSVDMVKLREALLTSSAASDSLKEWDRVSFTWAMKDMQIVSDMTDKSGLSLPLTGAIKEVVKEARRAKASNPPNWTGNKPLKYE